MTQPLGSIGVLTFPKRFARSGLFWRSSGVRNEQFGAQRLKDAIVDQFRTKGLSRPTVDLKAPDVRVHARLHKGALSLAIDLSGDSLHRRGYRLDGGLAPLKENIAAAALWAAGWSSERAQEQALIDPMCGSSTLLLRARSWRSTERRG